MNRREFTASLAAMVAAPILPTPVLATHSTQTALPPATYLWADMIARARGHVDAGFLARRLGLSPDAAQTVMSQLLENGVVGSPGVTGIAKAARPVRFDTLNQTDSHRIADKIRHHVQEVLNDTEVAEPEPTHDEPRSSETAENA